MTENVLRELGGTLEQVAEFRDQLRRRLTQRGTITSPDRPSAGPAPGVSEE
jgi:hypothetical protein